ncbi:MAG: GIN domain-containing protein [Cyclonatronaceae bacterium]
MEKYLLQKGTVNPVNNRVVTHFIIMVLMFLTAGCQSTILTKTGSGRIAEDYRELDPFTRIVITGTYNIEVVRDSLHYVIVELDDNLTRYVKTSVDEGSLHIRTEERFTNFVPVRLLIGALYISHIRTQGNHKLVAAGIDNDILEVSSTGTMHMELAGLVDQLNLVLDGRCVVNAGSLEALYVQLKSTGISTSTVNAVRTIRAEGTGSTRVWYLGSPGTVESEIEGRGFLMKAEKRAPETDPGNDGTATGSDW